MNCLPRNARSGVPLNPRRHRRDALSARGAYPLLDTVFTEVPDLDALFEFGLRRTLDGIAVLLGETSA